jgi:hypothetical protein
MKTLTLLASAALLFLVACQQAQTPPPAAQSQAAVPTKEIHVVFEGPWVIVPDPKDANSVLLLAPKTAAHRNLYVAASNNSSLEAGTYDLTLLPRSGSAAGTFDESILRAKIDPVNVQHVLDDKSSKRYAIRLPKPNAYVPASRHRSRVSATYPPEPTAEKEYATGVSLRYTVGSMSGFSLAGTLDNGTFTPMPLQVETPTIRFVIEPAHDLDPSDKCLAHARQTFHEAATMLAVNLFVDFPESPATCHDTDPQKSRATKAGNVSPSAFERLLALLESDSPDANQASVAHGVGSFAGLMLRGPETLQRRISSLYLFGRPQGTCISPIIAAEGS